MTRKNVRRLARACCRGFWSRWRRFCAGEFESRLLRARQIIEHASAEQVRPRVEAFLNNTSRYETRTSQLLPKDVEKVKLLGKYLQEFFSQYEYVRPVYSDSEYSRTGIGPSKYALGRIRVGTTAEHAEFVVSPGEDVLFEVDGIGDSLELSESYPSIFHWLLLEEWLLTHESSLLRGLEDESSP